MPILRTNNQTASVIGLLGSLVWAREGSAAKRAVRVSNLLATLLLVCVSVAANAEDGSGAAPSPQPAAETTPDSASGPASGSSGPVSVPAGRKADTIALIPIHRMIDAVVSKSVSRRIEWAEQAGVDAIVFSIDTPGGAGGAMLEISTAIKETPLTTIAWVNTDAYSAGALIALACDTMVVDDNAVLGDALPIFAGPFTGTQSAQQMLDNDPDLKTKLLQPVLSDLIDSARRNGYDEMLVQGMVSRGVELWLIKSTKDPSLRFFVTRAEYKAIFDEDPPPGLTPYLASLSSEEAPPTAPSDTANETDAASRADGFAPATPNLAEPSLVEGINAAQEFQNQRDPLFDPRYSGTWELVSYISDGTGVVVIKGEDLVDFGLAEDVISSQQELTNYVAASNVITLEETWSEQMTRFLTQWWVRGLLVMVFLIGLFVEMISPGMAFPGGAALIALALLALPAISMDLYAWWGVAAIVIGIGLMLVEVFVTPGFGIFGITGLLALFAGLVGSLTVSTTGALPGVESSSAGVTQALLTVLLSTFTAGVVVVFFAKRLGELPVVSRLMLKGSAGQPDESSTTGTLVEMLGDETGPVQVGAVGVAFTALRPAGKVRIDDRIVDAMTRGDYLEADTPIIVTSTADIEIIVEPAPDAGDHGGTQA